jgi:hypothetical protein
LEELEMMGGAKNGVFFRDVESPSDSAELVGLDHLVRAKAYFDLWSSHQEDNSKKQEKKGTWFWRDLT